MIKYGEVDASGGGGGKSVKSCQKVEESSKSLKSLKDLKNLQRLPVRKNVYQSTDLPSIGYEKLKLLLEFWYFFELFLLGPEALLIPLSDRLSTRQSSPVSISGISSLSPLHQVFICGTVSLMAGKMLRELYITKACPMFLRSSKLSWLPRKLENSLPKNIIEFKASLYLQVLVLLVPLPSSTAVTTHTSSIKTSKGNIMTACLAWAWHSKSLFTGPLELRARIWLLIKLIPAWVSYV